MLLEHVGDGAVACRRVKDGRGYLPKVGLDIAQQANNRRSFKKLSFGGRIGFLRLVFVTLRADCCMWISTGTKCTAQNLYITMRCRCYHPVAEVVRWEQSVSVKWDTYNDSEEQKIVQGDAGMVNLILFMPHHSQNLLYSSDDVCLSVLDLGLHTFSISQLSSGLRERSSVPSGIRPAASNTQQELTKRADNIIV